MGAVGIRYFLGWVLDEKKQLLQDGPQSHQLDEYRVK